MEENEHLKKEIEKLRDKLLDFKKSSLELVSEDEYDQLVQKKEGGWSQCESSLEMLAKLHYLRLGFDAGKIQESDFLEREQMLVLNWWNRGS